MIALSIVLNIFFDLLLFVKKRKGEKKCCRRRIGKNNFATFVFLGLALWTSFVYH